MDDSECFCIRWWRALKQNLTKSTVEDDAAESSDVISLLYRTRRNYSASEVLPPPRPQTPEMRAATIGAELLTLADFHSYLVYKLHLRLHTSYFVEFHTDSRRDDKQRIQVKLYSADEWARLFADRQHYKDYLFSAAIVKVRGEFVSVDNAAGHDERRGELYCAMLKGSHDVRFYCTRTLRAYSVSLVGSRVHSISFSRRALI